MRSKIGISVGALGALVYFATLFGGYTAVLLIAGYIVIAEDNVWLKRAAVKAVVTTVAFSVLVTVINLVPNLLQWINLLVNVFEGSFNYEKVNSVIYLIVNAIEICKTVLMLILGVKALEQRTVSVPFVDKFLNKHF